MSLLIVSLAESRALVAVDTAAMFSDGTHGHLTKLFPLPHIGAVIAARGNGAVLAGLAMGQCSGAQSLEAAADNLLGNLPALLQAVRAGVHKHGRHEVHPALAQSLRRQEVVLVGWSERLGRMAGWTFCLGGDPGDQPITEEIQPGGCVFAPGGVPDDLPSPANPIQAIDVARWQVQNWRECFDVGARLVGGDLVCAALSRDAVSVTRHREFMSTAGGALACST